MRRRIEAACLASLAMAAPAVASAQQARSEFEEALGRPVRAPVVPPDFRAIVREATVERLVVHGLGGGEIAAPLGDIEAERLAAFADRRYLGFRFNGYEFYGYRLIDRRMAGEAAVIETGEAPVFSPDNRHFAAVQLSGAGFGNLEGVAIWRVEADRTRQILFSSILPAGEEWRVEGWPRPNCVAISYAVRDAEGRTDSQPRRHLAIGLGAAIRLSLRGDQPGCDGEPSGEDDDG